MWTCRGWRRQKAVMPAEAGHVKLICAMIALTAGCGLAAAETVPLPHPRPIIGPSDSQAPEPPAPSACRIRLMLDVAIAPSLPPIEGPGECGAPDVVRLEAVVLPDQSHVTLNPPATLRCTMAEAIVNWVREEAAPRALALGSPLRAIQNFDSFDCRGRNRIVGAKVSEHGKANALDIKSLKLADGRVIHLTDPKLSHAYREGMRATMCERFSTVLGPGSDGYHEDHIHVDLMALRPGRGRFCHWDVRDPEVAPAAAVATTVPLPLPRPKAP
jgi:hypothetical protein